MAKSPPQGSFRTPLLQSLALSDVSETGEKIGGGQHGAVSKGLWRGTPCAIKRLHLAPTASSYASMVDRIERECKLLCSLRHPNIAHFLGVLPQGESHPPALLWELCPFSLAAVVEAHPGLPLHLQLSLMGDVSQGLAYLHHSVLSPVVHGDLTASNVLLSPALQAKLADLGVARIVDASKTPRTAAYLPPEALSSKPRFTPSVDVFSFGNLILHLVCRRWPLPSEPSRGLKSGATEVERRRQYVDLMGPGHPLAKLVQLCLHSDPEQRPKTLSIVSQLSELSKKERPQFETLLDLLIGMDRRESELLHTAEDVGKKREELQSVMKQLKNRDTEMAGLQERVRVLEEEVASEYPMRGLLQPPSASGKNTVVSLVNDDNTGLGYANSAC